MKVFKYIILGLNILVLLVLSPYSRTNFLTSSSIYVDLFNYRQMWLLLGLMILYTIVNYRRSLYKLSHLFSDKSYVPKYALMPIIGIPHYRFLLLFKDQPYGSKSIVLFFIWFVLFVFHFSIEVRMEEDTPEVSEKDQHKK